MLAWGNIFIYAGALALIYAYLVVPATSWFQGKLLPALENGYKSTLAFALKGRKPGLFFAGTFLLLLFSAPPLSA